MRLLHTGLLMTVTALVACGPAPARATAIREELAGVICRCTGYEFIVTAVEGYLASVGLLESPGS